MELEGQTPGVMMDNVLPRIQKVDLYGHIGYMYIGRNRGKGVFAYKESGQSGTTKWDHIKCALVKRDPDGKIHLKFRYLKGAIEKQKQRHQRIIGVDIDLALALAQCIQLCLAPQMARPIVTTSDEVVAEQERTNDLKELMQGVGRLT